MAAAAESNARKTNWEMNEHTCDQNVEKEAFQRECRVPKIIANNIYQINVWRSVERDIERGGEGNMTQLLMNIDYVKWRRCNSVQSVRPNTVPHHSRKWEGISIASYYNLLYSDCFRRRSNEHCFYARHAACHIITFQSMKSKNLNTPIQKMCKLNHHRLSLSLPSTRIYFCWHTQHLSMMVVSLPHNIGCRAQKTQCITSLSDHLNSFWTGKGEETL